MKRLLLAALLVVAACVLAVARVAGAAVTVVSCQPFGTDDLQAKINGAAVGDTLSIRGTCTGNFLITQSVTLQAAGSGASLNGGGTGNTVLITGGLDTIRGLTITGGLANQGGGIRVDEGSTLNLVDSTVRGNTAIFVGGGIVSGQSTLNLVNSNVSGNTTQFLGGGIASFSATLNLTGSTVSGNSATDPDEADGGGIEIFGSTATLTASTVRDNTSGNNGAGIGKEGTGTALTLTNSTISGNTGGGAGAGIGNFGGALALTNSSVEHNTGGSGGGIFNDAGYENATLTINNSTVSFNKGMGEDPFFGGGGGITNFAELGNTASLIATHLTMTGNTAPAGHGGGIADLCGDGRAALVTVAQSMIGPVNNSPTPNTAILGGGIYNDGTQCPASVSLQPGTIIAHNQATNDGGGLYNTGTYSHLLIGPGAVFLFNSPDNISDESPGGNS